MRVFYFVVGYTCGVWVVLYNAPHLVGLGLESWVVGVLSCVGGFFSAEFVWKRLGK